MRTLTDNAMPSSRSATTTSSRKHRQRGFSDQLLRERIELTLSDEKKAGASKTFFTKVKEELQFITARLKVLKYWQEKAMFEQEGEEHILAAIRPVHPLDKCTATTLLLAYIITSKYADGLPLYRLENMLALLGHEVSRTSMAHWIIRLEDVLKPLIQLMREVQNGSDYLQADGTRIQTGDDTPLGASASGGIPDWFVDNALLAVPGFLTFYRLDIRCHHGFQSAVLRQANDVIDPIPVAPRQQLWPAEPAVGSDDLGLRPGLAQISNQQSGDGPGMCRDILATATQVAHEQVSACKDVERQEAVAIVVPIEMPTALLAMNSSIGRMEVENDLFWWLLVGCYELILEDLMGIDERLPIHTLLKTAQG